MGGRREEMYLEILYIRGIDGRDEACPDCGGLGVKTYGGTSTWRGGVGGQTLTNDVCDKCWGSGHRHKPWPSHRLLKLPAAPSRDHPHTNEGRS